MFSRFFGGVHPRNEKGATRRLARERLDPPPARVVLPLSMHAGAPCTPRVAAGDSVRVGQVVGTPVGYGASIHASVSGTVAAVEEHPLHDGTSALSVVIDNDFQDTPAPGLPVLPFYSELTPDEILMRIAKAGIVGLGGSCVPTEYKLRTALGRVDTLILNGAECEPYLTADHRLMVERPEDVLTGARILMRALGLKRAVIGVAGSRTDAVIALQGLLPLRGGDILVKPISSRYPQGAERQLVQRITGRRVPPGGGSVDVKCVVFNVATAAAVQAAVVENRILTERTVTVSGSGVGTPKNLIVPIGTPLSHLLEAAGGLTPRAVRVLVGGPMMGIAQTDLSVPVLKGTGGVVALTRFRLARHRDKNACIRCGRCVAVCPMRLMPLVIRRTAAADRDDALAKLHPEDCTACGACAFICPARLPLTQSVRAAAERLKKIADAPPPDDDTPAPAEKGGED